MKKIQNDILSISINEHGAELKNITTLKDNYEYLWQGSKDSWNRTSPILFPIIGGINNDKYTINDKEYTLTSHGFARNMEFTIEKETSDSIFFSVTYNNETLKKYPFKFKLILGYKLVNNSVEVSYEVKNLDDKPISFSIGGHPGFNCPMDKGLNFTDYALILNEKETSKRLIKVGNVLTGERRDFLKNQNKIELTNELFKEGALIFDDLKSESITLKSPKGKRSITMNFQNFPYFGIWSWPPLNQPYVCLEPWYGIDSTKGESPEWFNKPGLEQAQEGESFKALYTIEVK